MPFDAIVESSDPVLDSPGVPIALEPDISEWPYPRFFVGKYNTICVSKQSNNNLVAYEMKLNSFAEWEGYPSADLGPADAITTIDFADFGLFYVLLANSNVFLRNVQLDPVTVDRDIFGLNLVQPSVVPVFSAVCNFNGQAVVGNLGNWQDCGSNAFAWSGIKNYEFDPLVDQSAGWDVLLANDSSGDILKIYSLHAMESRVISFTSHGVFSLEPRVNGDVYSWGITQLMGLGTREKTHAAGDHTIIGFIDSDNEFWKIENNGQKFTKSGFKKDIEELIEVNAPIIVSYLKPRREFYISNGVKSLIINDYGSCTVHQAVSSCLVGWDGMSYGTFRDFEDHQARIVVDTSDFGSRGKKTVESVMVGAKLAEESVLSVASYWRNSPTANFGNVPRWVFGGPGGEGRIGITSSEFRIAVRVDNYVGVEIQTIKVNLKFPDARFRRGVAATATGGQAGVE